ncbi:MAG TPA: RND transporter, partial [Thermoanaerobaculia bacterium]|nr:RND transporter [Thermoanaerobaculia bacterium]
MDKARNPEKKNRRRILWIVGVIVAVVVTTVALGRLKPAAPPVDDQTLVIETVERGPLTRAVRGSGVLTAENVRWIAAATEGRVERVVVQPGTRVTSDTVILELSDPQLQQSTRDAQWQLRAAESAYAAAQAELESDRLDREAAAANLRAEARQARLRAKADAELAAAGLAAAITKELSDSAADALE